MLLLGKQITKGKWVALLLLLFGVIVVQVTCTFLYDFHIVSQSLFILCRGSRIRWGTASIATKEISCQDLLLCCWPR